jgi:hypothetical protein
MTTGPSLLGQLLLYELAAQPLPVVAQRVMAQTQSVSVRTQLAAQSGTDLEVINFLARDPHVTVSSLALRHSNDLDLLIRHSQGTGARACAAAANPLTPADSLAAILSGPRSIARRGVTLRALCNPSSPEPDRRKHMEPEWVHALTRSHGNASQTLTQAFELVENNPWLAHTPERWSIAVRRAITCRPQMTAEQAQRITTAGFHRWESLTRHPVHTGVDVHSMSTPELVMVGGPATDLMALRRADVSEQDVHVMMCNPERPAPEPFVIARAMRSFGFSALASSSLFFSGTRLAAATWCEPRLGWIYVYVSGLQSHIEQGSAIMEILGEDEQAWGSFLSLLRGWSTPDFVSLAQIVAPLNS